MKVLTNNFGVPEAIVDAIKDIGRQYDYHSGVMSITTLLKPARIHALELQHENDITEDAADQIYVLVGSIVHNILDRADQNKAAIREERFFSNNYGIKISGKIDRYCDGVIQDYKFQTVYKVKNGQASQEQEAQLNCYAQLMRENGHQVKRLELVSVFRDWSKNDALKDKSYPQKQTMTINVPLWSEEEAKSFIQKRVEAHQKAKHCLPLCSPDERWEKPTMWAVMKNGNKVAKKLHPTEKGANEHAQSLGAGHRVDKREGASVRCANWCNVSEFCEQWKRIKESVK